MWKKVILIFFILFILSVFVGCLATPPWLNFCYPPTGILASDGLYYDNVMISWDSVTGATYYQVYRATSLEGLKTSLSSWQTDTSYSDSNATPGITYYYWVKAATRDSGDNASDYSLYDIGWRALAPPQNVNASDGTYSIMVCITWESENEASYYRVYRATSLRGSKTSLGSWQTGTSYGDSNVTPGITYYYWVKAATSDSGDNASDYSDCDSGYSKLPDTNLPSPTVVLATDGTSIDEVYVSCNSVSGATHYRVYRATSSEGLKTSLSGWQTDTSYSDDEATPGIIYYYFVKAATSDSGDNASDYSLYDIGWRALAPPQNINVSDNLWDNVMITWDSVTGATYYQVYRTTSPAGLKTSLSGWQTDTSYSDSNVTPGITYYYWVKAATSDSGDNASDYSDCDSGYSHPEIPVSTGISATDGTSIDEVYITWNSVSGATHYQIYRATSSGGSKISLSGWQTDTSYSDDEATSGIIYYYFVKAAPADSGDNASDYSDCDSGWRTLAPPSFFRASNGFYQDKVVINWGITPGANYFQVYRATSPAGSKTSLSGWQMGSLYCDYDATPGTTYYYWVKTATSSSGEKASDYSDCDYGWRALAPPQNVNASDGLYCDNVMIKWDSVADANYYRVYRAISLGGSRISLSGWQTDTSYSDSNATPGITYYYFIKAAPSISETKASDYSDCDSGWRALAPPQNVNASDNLWGNVTITWDSVTGANYYQIYRATSATGSKISLGSWQTSRFYYDDDIIPGSTYYYFVKAANNSSGEIVSDYSDCDSGLSHPELSAPTGVKATYNILLGRIDVTWYSVSDATHYQVYSDVNGNRTAITGWLSGTSFRLEQIISLIKVNFWVKAATSSSGANASDYSNVSSWKVVAF